MGSFSISWSYVAFRSYMYIALVLLSTAQASLIDSIAAWQGTASGFIEDITVITQLSKQFRKQSTPETRRILETTSYKFQDARYWTPLNEANARVSRTIKSLQEEGYPLQTIRNEEMINFETALELLLQCKGVDYVVEYAKYIKSAILNIWAFHDWLAGEFKQSETDRQKVEAAAALETWKSHLARGNSQRRRLKSAKTAYVELLCQRSTSLSMFGSVDPYLDGRIRRAYAEMREEEISPDLVALRQSRSTLVKALLKLDESFVQTWWPVYNAAKTAEEDSAAALRRIEWSSDNLVSQQRLGNREAFDDAFAAFSTAVAEWNHFQSDLVLGEIYLNRTLKYLVLTPAMKARRFQSKESVVAQRFIDKVSKPLAAIETTRRYMKGY